MSRNGLYLIIGALIVLVVGFAFHVIQEETKPSGIEMRVGEDGISIEQN